MALINCPECKKEISNKATACPHCGCPIGKKPKSSSDKLLDVVRFLLIIFILGYLLIVIGSIGAGFLGSRVDSSYDISASQDDEIVLKKQWRQLKQGLTQKEVKDILGEPLEVESSSIILRWKYDNFGYVEFSMVDYKDNKDRLESWDEPAWKH